MTAEDGGRQLHLEDEHKPEPYQIVSAQRRQLENTAISSLFRTFTRIGFKCSGFTVVKSP